MRRRLKTAKKTKKETNSKKTLSKKTPSKKTKKQKVIKKEKEEKEVSKKTTVSVRVLARPKKSEKAKKPVIELEIDKEKELKKKKEEARKGKKIEKDKIGKPKVIKAEVENEIERHKMIIMWSGIIFFMILISVFWISNTKRVVEKSKARISQESETKPAEWNDLVDKLSDKIVEMKGNLKNIDEFNNGKEASSTPATLSEGTKAKIKTLTEDEFKKIDEKIKPELKDKIRFIY